MNDYNRDNNDGFYCLFWKVMTKNKLLIKIKTESYIVFYTKTKKLE